MDSLININDLSGLTQPMTKLIETLGNGIGLAAEPLLTYLNGKAEANKYLRLEKAKVDAEIYRFDKEDKERYVIQERAFRRELNRQKNICDIANIAANELKDDASISDKEVSNNWITRFINTSEDVNEEKLKIIWGKILAGEVRAPGSYSLRTLETLKNLSEDEAQLFVRACTNAIGNQQYSLINTRHYGSNGYGLTLEELYTLIESGLLMNSFETKQSWDVENGKCAIIYQDYAIVLSVMNETKIEAPELLFSSSGNELYKIVGKKFDMDNVRFIASYFKGKGVESAYLEKILKFNNDETVNTDEKNAIPLLP